MADSVREKLSNIQKQQQEEKQQHSDNNSNNNEAVLVRDHSHDPQPKQEHHDIQR